MSFPTAQFTVTGKHALLGCPLLLRGQKQAVRGESRSEDDTWHRLHPGCCCCCRAVPSRRIEQSRPPRGCYSDGSGRLLRPPFSLTAFVHSHSQPQVKHGAKTHGTNPYSSGQTTDTLTFTLTEFMNWLKIPQGQEPKLSLRPKLKLPKLMTIVCGKARSNCVNLFCWNVSYINLVRGELSYLYYFLKLICEKNKQIWPFFGVQSSIN